MSGVDQSPDCEGREELTETVFDRVRTIASDVFGVPLLKITPDSAPQNIEPWDSVQHLNFVLAIEEAFQLQLSPEETDRMSSIGQAVQVLEEKMKAAGG
jgi:acyl carrier protein